ncbi:hypothetical protein [Tahibacter sp.]|uniref:hypothetical protein n=1 Tax=Tahibacter sp. TaxID=2056211 RepID=UPI0028C481A9|nr:hypothetical protein [Tahibacter sp.]
MFRVLALATALVALSACSGSDKPAAPPPPPPAPTQTPTPTVIDPQLQALQRAKAVQGQVDAQKEATDAKLREAEGQ